MDAIIFDLEDAVAPDEKAAARDTLAAALAAGGYGARTRIVRINGLDTEWGAADAARRGRDGLRRGAAAQGRRPGRTRRAGER